MALISNWTYQCYKNRSGRNQITPTLTALSKKGKMQLLRTLQHLSTKPQISWSRPHACPAGNHIYVIHFHDENRTQHRIFGHHEEVHEEFVMTLCGIEKDDTYEPSNYESICAIRRGECLANAGRHKCSCLSADTATDSLSAIFGTRTASLG